MRGSQRGVILAVVVIALSAALGGIYGERVQATVTGDTDLQQSLAAFTKVYAIVEQNYADSIDPERTIYQGAIPGMLRVLDPHSTFFDPRSFRLLREDQRGHYFGVGMQVGPRDGRTIVIAPFVGSPAYRAGLRPGDVIVQVDDMPTQGLTTAEVADRLKGPKGTVVRVKVLREGHDEPLDFVITRDEIPRTSVEYVFELRPGVAYVKLRDFNETTQEELQKALGQFDLRQLKGLLFDLRGNPGGLLTQGVAVADMFLAKNQLIVSHRGRAQRDRRYYATRGNDGVQFPLVVLLDRYSASASEIVAGAIQDHDRGLIVGETSFGKALVQTVYPLSQDTGVALTTAMYYTPSGRLIQRDFKAVSLYSYYVGRNRTENNNQGQVFKTDSGRTVFGGGGITPDVIVPHPPMNRFQELLRMRDAFFNFAKHFLADRDTVPRDFEVTDYVLNRFRAFLDQQHIRFTEPDIQENRDWIARQIKKYLFTSVFGLPDGFRVELEGDYQVQKALELLPQAADLAATASRVMARRER
ncbi:MAG: S41 family peptidase [Acidobacteria bacterium]|nr:S41 family peptidase [Acidobacteriota bacterium]